MGILFGKNKKTGWTTVIVDADAVRGVTVAPPTSGASGKPRVLACAAQPTNELSGKTLAALAKTLHSNGGPWLYALRRQDYKILVLPEPAVLPTEMEQSLRWTLTNQVDYPIGEATIAWMKIPTAEQLPNRPTHLYVMVARREVVSQAEQMFAEAGLALTAVDVHETAQRNIANLMGKPNEGVGLLRLGRDGVQFTVSYNGELYLDRFVEESLFNDSTLDPESEQRAIERIALQVQRSLAFVERNMPFITVGRVLIAPLPRPMALEKSITEYLDLPVETLNLANCFDCTLVPDLLQEKNQAIYFTALGAALRFTDH
jgi:MSHA biogenesis protein MshI